MIKVAIVDDEENALYAIRTYVEKSFCHQTKRKYLCLGRQKIC